MVDVPSFGGRCRRAVTGRRLVLHGALVWALTLAGFRLVVALPERCPDTGAAELRDAARSAVEWFERNQQPDGTWTYLVDFETGREFGPYNLVRHAGVTMSLYQAAAAGIDGALRVADAGSRYALRHLVEGDGWSAFGERGSDLKTGSTALLVAGLSVRRLATGDPRFDDQLGAMGRFLEGQVEPDGAVLAQYDTAADRPVPGVYSIYYTGEALWALALLHRAFPTDGWDVPARSVAAYVATTRDENEDQFPPIPDHWSAYGLSEIGAWPTPAASLSEAEASYARRLGGLLGVQARWESQGHSDRWARLVRGGTNRGAAVGTWGEGLAALWRLSRTDARLSDLSDDLSERTRCVAAVLADRQVEPSEADGLPRPDVAEGGWISDGELRMDDVQHALSALVAAAEVHDATVRHPDG